MLSVLFLLFSFFCFVIYDGVINPKQVLFFQTHLASPDTVFFWSFQGR